jgi:hypothetical protein
MRDIDPTTLDAPISDSSEIIRIETRYHCDSQIPCCIGRCHRPHNDGFVVLLKNGKFSRIGHICGKHLLGSDKFTVLHDELVERERRTLREQFFKSPDFDPEGAQAVLPSWDARLEAIQLARTVMDEYGLTERLQIAVEKDGGWFSITNEDGLTRKAKLRSVRFLAQRWERLYDLAKSDLKLIIRQLGRPNATPVELTHVAEKVAEAHRRLTIVADIIEPVGHFFETMAYLLEGKPLYTFGPLDRSPIAKLETDPPDSPKSAASAA